MTNIAASFAKLAGIRKAVQSAMEEDNSRGDQLVRPIQNFSNGSVGHYFANARKEAEGLRLALPDLYADFADFAIEPEVQMVAAQPGGEAERRFSRAQMQRLVRDIDQIFEIRANSELASPVAKEPPRKVFVSHGRSSDWREVQAYIERDIKRPTLELAQEPNQGMTVLGKLVEAAEQCDSAVIVMTGDDLYAEGQVRARENVIHEIGYFQGRYGLSRVVLLHEEGVNIPSNIQGLVYTAFPKGVFRLLSDCLSAS